MSEDFLSGVTDGALNDQRRWKVGLEFLDFSIISFSSFCVSLGGFELVPLDDHRPGPLSNILISVSLFPVFTSCVGISECFGLPAVVVDSLQPASSLLAGIIDGVLNSP